ncbi:nucleoside monophosphate kinase [uncultured Winogradskyella sp.]|uniref:adenylate kinase family protein n=1 Tax=uncultured Winogradskyella sp. TaxID=395353 RepID=UPI002621191A|nr:nucleoside monophosphate kinase [uncultured Winogradskyella sp.]|tara:strand:- start:7268 stop:7837 length:570 start_codon:yes stop_codon:yes gene_type:complete
MDIVVITGPPYSGKGTQCEFLKDIFGYKHISTGDRCRNEKLNKTEIGQIMSEYEEKGDLVPDEIMKNLFGNILDENSDNNGVILDGYPRTKAQVNDLLEIVEERQLRISSVVNIEVPKEELLKRAEKRAETSNRKDDKDKAIHLKRINVFETLTKPAIAYMKTKLKVEDFDGLGSIEDITKTIKSRILN